MILLNFPFFVLFIGLPILILALIYLHRRGRSPIYLAFFTLFWGYLLLVADSTILPLPIRFDITAAARRAMEPYIFAGININPFYFRNFPYPGYLTVDLVANIFLTIPFGFGINFLRPVRARRIFWVGLAVGLSIETTQLVINLAAASSMRVVDINDVLMNTLGILLGYALFRLFARAWLWWMPEPKKPQRGLRAYLSEVVNQVYSGKY